MNVFRFARIFAVLRQGGYRSPLVPASILYTMLRRPSRVQRLPLHIKLETTSRCNLACEFCSHTYLALQEQGGAGLSTREILARTSRFGQHMDLATFQSIVAQFPDLASIDLQGVGEPLLNPHFIDILEWCTTRHISTQFFTNATVLTPQKARAIVNNRVSQVLISFDGATEETYESLRRGAKFQLAIDNIAAFCEYRRSQNKPSPYIFLAVTLMRPNQREIVQLVELAKKIGVDAIIVSHLKILDASLTRLEPDPDVVSISVEEAAHRARELHIAFTNAIPLPHKPERGDGEPIDTRSYRRCLRPWGTTNITIDGHVTPCCYITRHTELCMGNIYEKSFIEIWNDEPYQKLRTALRTGQTAGLVCDRCQDYT